MKLAGFSQSVTGASLLGVIILVAGTEVHAFEWLSHAAIALALGYVLVNLPRTGRKGIIFVGLSILALTLPLGPDELAAEKRLAALHHGGFVMALYAALSFLQAAASSSPMVHRCGRFLTAQPPGRRYAALTLGGHLFGLVLSYGAISLLGAMSQRGNRREQDVVVRELRLKRMLLAAQRGFVGTLIWSPLGLSMAVTLNTFQNVRWEDLLPYCASGAAFLVVLGWLLDRATKTTGRPSSLRGRATGSWHTLAPVVALVALVFGCAFAIREFLDTRIVVGVIISVPLVAVVWMFAQYLRRGASRAARMTGRRFARHVSRAFPDYRNEISLLWSAAVLGIMVGWMLTGVGLSPDPAALERFGRMAPIMMLWLITLAGQSGMNPIFSVTLLGQLLPEAVHVSQQALSYALAFTGGWALSGASSPFTATTMLVGRIGGVSATTVGLHWNGGYTLAGLAGLSLLIALI